jgi:hypothetical protein
LKRNYAQERGRILGGIGGLAAVLGGLLLIVGLLASSNGAEAQPVDITATFTPLGGGSWDVDGNWSVEGNQCWTDGSRFHDYLIYFTSPTGPDNPTIPVITVIDNAPGGFGAEDDVNSADPALLDEQHPAPCNVVAAPGGCGTAICEPRNGAERTADAEPFSNILNNVPPGVFICVAVLHVSPSGNDKAATDCNEAPTPTQTPTPPGATPTNTPTVTPDVIVVQPPSVGDGGVAGGPSGGESLGWLGLTSLLTGAGLLAWERRLSSRR